MKIIDTTRLTLRELAIDDAAFMVDLLNQLSFIKYIGDRGVRNIVDVRTYIEKRFLESYQQFGFRLYLVELKENQIPTGICGFVKRETLLQPDLNRVP